MGDLDRARIADLHARELDRFRADRPGTLAMIDRARAHMPNGLPMAWMASDNEQPVYVDHGAGSSFTDLDGFSYVDFNASDMAMFCGHANPDIVAAISAQAARSTMFLLPTEADGIEAAIGSAGLPWTVIRLGPRSGQWYGPQPRTGAEAHALTDPGLTRLIRIWLANRGIWEALPGAGPTVPVPATRADVQRYLQAYGELLAALR